MKCRFALVVGLAMGLPTSAHAQAKDGSYYCVTEFSGGLSYNETLKRWQSTRFSPKEKFVANFKYAEPHVGAGGVSYTDDYYVTITPSGSDKTEDCLTYYPIRSQKIEFIRDSWGSCETHIDRYRFNLTNKRFLQVFENGYINGGEDKGSDTPSISGGTCTKIQ